MNTRNFLPCDQRPVLPLAEAMIGTVVQSQRLAAQTRLLQLASQALPTGAYAYSVGLESMLELGWLEGPEQCRDYLVSLMKSSVVYLELPLFMRMFDALEQKRESDVRRASVYLMACRETKEFQAQEEQMARALGRVLSELCFQENGPSSGPSKESSRGEPQKGGFAREPITFSEALARGARWFQLSRDEACVLLAYTWVEQQVSALCRLLPLGPIAGQKLLDAVLRHVPAVIDEARAISPSEIGAGAPGLAIASALHETQYCRIFRS